MTSAAGKLPEAASQIQVTVAQNSSETVIDLGAAFSAASGIQHGGGVKLSILGNTNSGLVTTDLSESALTLTYAPRKYGMATIIVSATDADGVSVTQTFVVTVRAPGLARVAQVTPTPASMPAPKPLLPSH
jgi:hypothetical protein